jgi:hypothetical protein
MLLANPASYISLAQFRAQANDIDFTSYNDAALTDILVRASGSADSIMRRSYLPQEVTEYFEGVGTNTLQLDNNPIIYMKRATLDFPGFAPFDLPIGSILIDYERGFLRSFAALVFRTLGVSAVFPRGSLPIAVQYAYGYGYPIPAPVFTMVDGGNGTLTPGQSIDVQVTSRTQAGESLPTAVQTFTPIGGAFQVEITPQPGASLYRVYAALHNSPTKLVAESPATNYGAATINLTIGSLSAPQAIGPLAPPTTDTSPWPVPPAIVEATRLLTLSMIFEQNNPANRGLYRTRSNKKDVSYVSTEGRSGKGTPTLVEQATNMLAPYSLQAIF